MNRFIKTVHGSASITADVLDTIKIIAGGQAIFLTKEDFSDLAMAFRQGDNCGFPFPEKEANPFQKEFDAILRRHKEITTGTIKLLNKVMKIYFTNGTFVEVSQEIVDAFRDRLISGKACQFECFSEKDGPTRLIINTIEVTHITK